MWSTLWENGKKQSLNVRQVATGSDVQILPPDEIVIWSFTFTPDGNYVDYVLSEKNNPFNIYLYRVPVLGGTPRLVMQEGIDGSSSYSPDGTHTLVGCPSNKSNGTSSFEGNASVDAVCWRGAQCIAPPC